MILKRAVVRKFGLCESIVSRALLVVQIDPTKRYGQEANVDSIVAFSARAYIVWALQMALILRALYFVTLPLRTRHYCAAFVRGYRLFLPGSGTGTRVSLHFAFNIPSPMRRAARHDASGSSAWMVPGIFCRVIVCTYLLYRYFPRLKS